MYSDVRSRARVSLSAGASASHLSEVPSKKFRHHPESSWAIGSNPGAARASSPSSETQIDYGIPGLQSFIDDDWVVVATDYQGLGSSGVHQYTVNRTNGIDAVTIVAAARELPVGAGTRFGVIGWSQGGGSAAASVELDASDYGELEIVGAVCMSPGVPSIALKLPGLGSALGGNDIPPDGHLFMILAGMATAFPDTLSLDDVFTANGRRVFDQGWNSQPVHHFSDTLGRAYKHGGQVMAVDSSKIAAWLQAFNDASAAQRKPIAPVLVQIDRQMEDGPCPVPWQLGYIDAISALGGDISSTTYPDDDHFSLPQHAIGEARDWLAVRFLSIHQRRSSLSGSRDGRVTERVVDPNPAHPNGEARDRNDPYEFTL